MGHWANRFLPEIIASAYGVNPNFIRSNAGKGNIRFHNKGSLSLQEKEGGHYVFYSFENPDFKGDAVNFVMAHYGLDMRGALQWLDKNYGHRAPAGERDLNGYAESMSGIVYGEAASKPVPASPPPLKVVPDSDAPTKEKKFVAAWHYHDAEGNKTLKVTRYAYADGTKDYRQMAFVDGKAVTPTEAKKAGRYVNYPYDYHLWHNAPADAIIFLTEGEKCADIIKKLDLYSSTNAGGASKWTDDLAPFFKGRNVIVMPDADEAGAKWRDAVVKSLAPVCAKLHVATIGAPGDKSLNDVADWISRRGSISTSEFMDEVRRVMTPVPTEEAAPVGDQRFKLVPFEEFKLTLNNEWLVKTFIPRVGVGLIFGASQTYKSFIAVDFLVAIASGQTHWGEALIKTHGAVVYICAEGGGGIQKRFLAAANKYGIKEADKLPLYVINERPRLGVESGDKEAIMQAIAAQVPDGTKVVAVVLDTLSQSLGGGEENGGGTQMVLGALTDISRVYDCAAIAIHHVGKGDDKSPRGHSSLNGNPDFKWFIEGGEDRTTTITLDKVKDGEDGIKFDVALSLVELGVDAEGAPVTTLIVKSIDDAASTSKTPPIKVTGNPRYLLNKMVDVVNDNPDMREFVTAKTGSPIIEGVEENAVRERWVLDRAGANPPKQSRDNENKAFDRAKSWLLNNGVICLAPKGEKTYLCKIRETQQ